MSQKLDVLQTLSQLGIIAVIREKDAETSAKTAQACIAGGVRAVEVSYTVPHASQAISDLTAQHAKDNTVVIGAGTILDVKAARAAISAHAQFIMGPNFNRDICDLCNHHHLPYFPGCMTINEMLMALDAGADVIKLFPCHHLTPDFLRAIKTPLPHLPIIPAGGITLENAHGWIKNGAFAVIVGSALTSPAQQEDYAQVTARAKQFIQSY